jgi:hypothetical protein
MSIGQNRVKKLSENSLKPISATDLVGVGFCIKLNYEKI